MSKDALLSYRGANRRNIRTFAVCVAWVAVSICFSFAAKLEAADYQTPNFIIRNAPSHGLAKQFGDTAERCRKELAILWLGYELPRWSVPCPVTVKVGNYGARGETSMQFDRGEVYDWDMQIQGTAESILTAVLPHEITHTILASHFRRPPPRWLDEGAATFVENDKERDNYRRLLNQYLRTGRGIPFNPMFGMGQYPEDQMPLYAQGFSLAEFLILQQGCQHYIRFAGAGMRTNNWPQAMSDYYGYDNLGELQVKWVAWVEAGCPDWNQFPQDQPFFVSDTTQYVASRDFMPTRQPIILARANTTPQPGQGVIPASYQAASPVQNAVAMPQPQREPIRMALAQTQQEQPLVARVAPIPESGNVSRFPGLEAPSAIFAQPVGPTTVSITENRYPSHFMEKQPEPVQQYAMPGNDSPVIFDWKIR